MSALTTVALSGRMAGYEKCAACGGFIDSDSEWLGEDEHGKGWHMLHERCEYCGAHRQSKQPE